MEDEKYISLSRICTIYEVDEDFFDKLCEFGLLEVVSKDEERLVEREHLSDIETLMRLHYDLEINYPGLDAISHMLRRMREMQRELNELRNRLSL